MSKLTKLHLACVTVMAIFCAGYASALDASLYATTSKLATGKWVKVTIPDNGMYEITYDELRQMGFNNPERVKVYGSGGYRIGEVLNGTAVDDLVKVPILRSFDKICFYGRGSISFAIQNYSSTPHFVRTFNPYSQVGCYFLTENSEADLLPAKKTSVTVTNYVDTPVSLDYFIHENEQATLSSSGKEMLGEDFANGRVLIDYYLPNLADSSIVVHSQIGASASEICYANAVIHSGGATDTTAYTVSTSRIYKPANYVFYNLASPFASLQLTHPSEHGQYEPMLKFSTADGTASVARLDYFILTYKHHNIIREEDNNQLFMGYALTRGNERFMLPNASSSTIVWNITNSNLPQEMTTKTYSDETGSGLAYYTTSATTSYYVAFDPAKTLKKVAAYEDVPNQNLHGMAVPELLIITDKIYHDQAQRVADLHTSVDGISVAVVDQDEVFNEFSSGTRDGMAYRLLCKMLYDRDPAKFKNLLLFGTGTFDNREFLGKHPGALLTYQSDNSNSEDYSYTTDDFFAFLGDNSGGNISNEKLSIGVGRITCGDLEEAKSDVDKLVNYYANPDYGVWRNNALIVSDAPDKGQYMFQGEGYKNMIDNDLLTGMHPNTVHNSQFARSTSEPNITDISRKTATEGKLRMASMLKQGAYFATYVGHAGAISFTKVNNMWTTGDVTRNSYPHLPIMSTACCDVAHYDNNSRGIAELMFHKPDGGAIALFTSSRMVYATGNDTWNSYLIEGFFSNAANGVMPTLGDAYKYSKNSFKSSDTNKLSFFLLGDPAIKVNYPYTRFNITQVNTTDMTDSTAMAQISPLMEIDIKAQVVDEQGNLDTSFNGDATFTLYDREMEFTELSFKIGGNMVDRTIYLPREKLAEVGGRVTNGIFTGKMIVPKSPLAKNETVLLRSYAHKDNTNYMVNGFTKQITMLPYDESAAINDTEAPVITAMFVNDENDFANGAIVPDNSVLYITATDDQGISLQSNAVDNTMTLILDGGKSSFGDIHCYAEPADGSKSISIEFPMNNLSEGMHTLTFTVYDYAGNATTRTITFMVGQSGDVNLVADKLPAFLDSEVQFDLDTDLTRTPDVIVRVTDATGKLVWKTTANNFPITWDMKDMNGNKVPAGLYRYFGTYNDGANYGGTPINKLIVLDPIKSAN